MGSHYKERLAAIASLTPERIADLFFKEEDRLTVIMASSLVEDLLAFAIATKFRHMPEENAFNSLFQGPAAPLATFHAKILIARQMGVTSTKVDKDLKTIKGIRNGFAHTYLKRSFDDDDIKRQCQSLLLRPEMNPELAKKVRSDGHGRFVGSVVSIQTLLIGSMIYAGHEKTILKAAAPAIAKKVKEQFAARDFAIPRS